MAYMLRKVAKDWQHPKDCKGHYIPLFRQSYSVYVKNFEKAKGKWKEGLWKEFQPNTNGQFLWVTRPDSMKDSTFEEFYGKTHQPEIFFPDWPKEKITHFQMYEEVTEGTPVSPVFATIDELADWLAENLNDERYQYTSVEWFWILNKPDPSVGLIL